MAMEFFYYFQNNEFFFQGRVKDDFRISRENKVESHQFRQSIPLKNLENNLWLGIGGSTTYGMGVAGEDTWVAKLNKINPELHILNLGLLGGSLQEYQANFEGHLRKRIHRFDFIRGQRSIKKLRLTNWGWSDLRPQGVIVAPQINDIAPDIYLKVLDQERPLLSSLLNRLMDLGVDRTAVFFYLNRYFQRPFNSPVELTLSQEHINRIERSYEQRLTRFINEVKLEAQVVLVKFPLLHGPGDGEEQAQLASQAYGQSQYYADFNLQRQILTLTDRIDSTVLAKVAKNLQVPFICAFCRLGNKEFSKRMSHFVDQIHLNEVGHFEVAKELSNYLKSLNERQ